MVAIRDTTIQDRADGIIIGDRMDKDIRHSFEEMNNALKKKVEHDVR